MAVSEGHSAAAVASAQATRPGTPDWPRFLVVRPLAGETPSTSAFAALAAWFAGAARPLPPLSACSRFLGVSVRTLQRARSALAAAPPRTRAGQLLWRFEATLGSGLPLKRAAALEAAWRRRANPTFIEPADVVGRLVGACSRTVRRALHDGARVGLARVTLVSDRCGRRRLVASRQTFRPSVDPIPQESLSPPPRASARRRAVRRPIRDLERGLAAAGYRGRAPSGCRRARARALAREGVTRPALERLADLARVGSRRPAALLASWLDTGRWRVRLAEDESARRQAAARARPPEMRLGLQHAATVGAVLRGEIRVATREERQAAMRERLRLVRAGEEQAAAAAADTRRAAVRAAEDLRTWAEQERQVVLAHDAARMFRAGADRAAIAARLHVTPEQAGSLVTVGIARGALRFDPGDEQVRHDDIVIQDRLQGGHMVPKEQSP